MIEKIGTIKNPLTIIAIFAAIAEISGTGVLPFISYGNQGTYIWFLIIFPLLLILLFFITLNFNSKVLYAPSDFQNEDNYFKQFKSATADERNDKLKREVREIEKEQESLQSSAPKVNLESVVTSRSVPVDLHARYLLAEELVLNRLSKELGPVSRDMRLRQMGRTIIFDGLIVNEQRVIAIEVKYFRDITRVTPRFREKFQRLFDSAGSLPETMKNRFSLILAVVTEVASSDHEQQQLLKRLNDLVGVTPIPVEVRIFSLEELEKEFGQA